MCKQYGTHTENEEPAWVLVRDSFLDKETTSRFLSEVRQIVKQSGKSCQEAGGPLAISLGTYYHHNYTDRDPRHAIHCVGSGTYRLYAVSLEHLKCLLKDWLGLERLDDAKRQELLLHPDPIPQERIAMEDDD